MKNDAEIIPNLKEEIEITPEMIEAGEGFVYQYNPDGPGYSDGGEVAAEIYRAMERIRRRQAHRG